MSQSIAVDGLGGGFVDDQLGMRLAVRRLARKWHPVMFPETTSDAPSLLVNPATPPGRAVARGLVAPDTLFGAEAVNDAPMQVPLLDPGMRDGLLDGSIPWGPDTTPPGSVDHVQVLDDLPSGHTNRAASGLSVVAVVAAVWVAVAVAITARLVVGVIT